MRYFHNPSEPFDSVDLIPQSMPEGSMNSGVIAEVTNEKPDGTKNEGINR
jgi:hypothetical protein